MSNKSFELNYKEYFEVKILSADGKKTDTTLYDNSREAFVEAYASKREAVIINTRYRLVEMVNYPTFTNHEPEIDKNCQSEIDEDYPDWSNGAVDLENNYIPIYGRTEGNKDYVDAIKINLVDGPSETELLKSFMTSDSHSDSIHCEARIDIIFIDRNGEINKKKDLRVIKMRHEDKRGEGWYFIEIGDAHLSWKGYYNINSRKGDLKLITDILDTDKNRFIKQLIVEKGENRALLNSLGIKSSEVEFVLGKDSL